MISSYRRALALALVCGVWLPLGAGCGSDPAALPEEPGGPGPSSPGSSATSPNLPGTTPTNGPQPPTTPSEPPSPTGPPAPPASSSPSAVPSPTPPGSTSAPSQGPSPSAPDGSGGGGPMPPDPSGGMGNFPPGSAGAGGGDATVVVPTQMGDTFTLALADSELTLEGATGRITGLSHAGQQLLTPQGDSEPTSLNYGSSFWTSPQSDWNWPPPFEDITYTASIDAASNEIVSLSADASWGEASVKMHKRVSADAARQAFVIDYAIENTGAAELSVAPWEITRVASSGLVFFPEGSAPPEAAPDRTALTVAASEAGVVWYDLSAQTGQPKSRADGAEGWLAYVDAGVVFVKQFEDIAANASAPDHGEVEIYFDAPYTELEPQGPYAAVAAGETSAVWRVTWYVRALPEGVEAVPGNTALVEWVRTLLAP